MKLDLLISLTLAVLLLGCAGPPTSAPVVAPPSSVTLQPTAAAPRPSPVTPTALPSTRIPQVTAPTLTQPTVLARFVLNPLPGAGRGPRALARLGETIYVANGSSDNIAIVRDRRVRAFIPTPNVPYVLLADSARAHVYAGTYASRTLSLIEKDVVVKTVELSGAVQALALAGDTLYVGLGNSATIEVRDAATLGKKSAVKLSKGFDVLNLAVDVPRQRLYATVYGYVIALDLDTLKEQSFFEVPSLFHSFSVNPNDGTLWAGAYRDKEARAYLTAYDANGKELRSVPLESDLQQSVWDAAGRIYIPSSFRNELYVVEGASARVLATVHVGLEPMALALDETNHLLYVANFSSDNLTLIDTERLAYVGVIPVAMNLKTLVANEARGRVYAASASTDSVYVIEGGQVAREITVGRNPVDLARDPKTNRLFVASSADGMLTVVDENTLTISATKFITNYLNTVAVDASSNRLFAASAVLKLDTLEQEGVYYARGMTIGSLSASRYTRVNPARQKIYAVASNGVPGSNGRFILYTFAESNLAASKNLGGGNVTALALDPTTQRVYGASTHPMAYIHFLDVWDADDNRLAELPLMAYTTGMAVNPRTHHLFLAHAHTFDPYPGRFPKRDNAVQILDTRTLGEVGWLDVPGGPSAMTTLGDTLYVAGLDDGALTLLGDVTTAQPPAPTPTFTPTPWPSWTPSPPAPPRATATKPPALACAAQPLAPFLSKWQTVAMTALACPVGASVSGNLSYQPSQKEPYESSSHH